MNEEIKINILLVEDDIDHTELIKRALKRAESKFHLHAVVNISEAKLFLAENTPDLILTDLNLPDGSGKELITSIQENKSYPVLVITSQGDEQRAVDVMKAGAEDYIVKSTEMFSSLPHILERTYKSWQLKTAHLKAQDDLAKRESLLNTIITAANDGFFLGEPNGHLVEVNPAFCAMLGYEANELIGKHISEIDAKESKDDSEFHISAIQKFGKDQFETQYRRKDGSFIDVELSVNFLVLDKPYFVCFVRDITEKKKIQAEIKNRQALFNSLLSTTQDAFWLLDTSGHFIEINQAACEMLGYSAKEILGQHIQFVDAIESKKETDQNLQRIIESGAVRFETKHRRKDGQIIDVEVNANYIETEQGYFVCFARNITAQKSAAQALKLSEQRYSRVVNTANEGIWVFNKDFIFTYANQRMADLLGYEAQEIIGKELDDFIPETDKDDLKNRKNERIAGLSSQFERRFLHKAGHEIWTIVSATPILDEAGQFDGGFSMVTDISDRKEAEKALKLSEARFKKTFDQSPISKSMLDMNYRFVRCNEAFCSFLGYEHDELVGKTYLDVTYPEDEDIGKEEIQQLMRGEIEIIKLEKRYKHKDGHPIWGQTAIRLIEGEDENTKYFLPVIQNIHEQKIADAKVREREAQITSIFRVAPVGMGVVANRVLQNVNEHMCNMTGYTLEELIDQHADMLYPSQEESDRVGREKYEQISKNGTGTVETIWQRKDGKLINVLLSSTPFDLNDWEKGVTFTALDITERTEFLSSLAESESRFREVVNASPNSVMVLQDGKFVYANPFALNLLGYKEFDFYGKEALSVIHPEYHQQIIHRMKFIKNSHKNSPMVIKVLHKDGRWSYTETVSVPIEYNKKPAALIINHDINHLVWEEEITNARLHLLEFASSHSLNELLVETVEETIRLTESETGFYHFLNEDTNEISLQVWSKKTSEELCKAEPETHHYPIDQAGVWVDCVHERKPVIHNDYQALPHRKGLPEGHVPVVREVAVPVMRGEKIVAILGVGNKSINYNEFDVDIVSRLADLAWDIAERKRIEEENQRQLDQLTLLRDINLTISLHSGMSFILQEIIDRVKQLNEIDAVLIVDLQIDDLDLPIYQSGLPKDAAEQVYDNWLQVRERIFKNPEPVYVFDLKQYQSLTPEAMRDINAAIILPITSPNGQYTSLILASKSQVWLKEDRSDFLQSLAIQTTIAIENAAILQEMQNKNIELSEAYEAIIHGWSRALELRDKETQGHSQRVAELSVKLAKRCGYPERNMRDFYRGVLLHDIGKMGIPDSILLKPGPLSDDEWVIMRQHPTYGYELLKEIPDFQTSLDIPLFHHEKWDGSGYPNGMSGKDIPFGARIFAVVDVWDALTDDRPYRPAWPEKAALDFIKEQAGKHFDPEVVSHFVALINKA